MPTTVVSPGCLLLLHRRRRLILVRLHPEVLERVVQLLGLLQGHRLGCGGGGERTRFLLQRGKARGREKTTLERRSARGSGARDWEGGEEGRGEAAGGEAAPHEGRRG